MCVKTKKAHHARARDPSSTQSSTPLSKDQANTRVQFGRFIPDTNQTEGCKQQPGIATERRKMVKIKARMPIGASCFEMEIGAGE